MADLLVQPGRQTSDERVRTAAGGVYAPRRRSACSSALLQVLIFVLDCHPGRLRDHCAARSGSIPSSSRCRPISLYRLVQWFTSGTAQGSIWLQIWVTLEEAMMGFLSGAIAGVICEIGILLGRHRLAADVLIYLHQACQRGSTHCPCADLHHVNRPRHCIEGRRCVRHGILRRFRECVPRRPRSRSRHCHQREDPRRIVLAGYPHRDHSFSHELDLCQPACELRVRDRGQQWSFGELLGRALWHRPDDCRQRKAASMRRAFSPAWSC